MKRFSLYQIINLILVAVFVLAIIVQFSVPLLGLTWQKYWFPTLLILVSISMLFKAIIFTSDSALWLFTVLLLLGVGVYVLHIFSLPLQTYWVCALSFVSLASWLVGVVFKEIYQIKIGLVFFLISIPLYLYFFSVLNFWWSALVLLASVLLATISSMLLPERWYLKKRK